MFRDSDANARLPFRQERRYYQEITREAGTAGKTTTSKPCNQRGLSSFFAAASYSLIIR